MAQKPKEESDGLLWIGANRLQIRGWYRSGWAQRCLPKLPPKYTVQEVYTSREPDFEQLPRRFSKQLFPQRTEINTL